MATVTINAETKRKFVQQYTEEVFRKRLAEAGSRLPSAEKLADELEKQCASMFAKENKDENFRAVFMKEVIYINLHSFYYLVDVSPYATVLENTFANPDSWKTTQACRGSVTNVARFSNLPALSYQQSDNSIPTKEVFYMPPCMFSHNCGVFKWPVIDKKSEKNEDGSITRNLIIEKKYHPFITEAKRKKAIAFTEKLYSDIDAFNAVVVEAADFASNLWKILVGIRTVNKLEKDWPELLPEFNKITGLTKNMGGKALAVTADIPSVLKAINEYKGNSND